MGFLNLLFKVPECLAFPKSFAKARVNSAIENKFLNFSHQEKNLSKMLWGCGKRPITIYFLRFHHDLLSIVGHVHQD